MRRTGAAPSSSSTRPFPEQVPISAGACSSSPASWVGRPWCWRRPPASMSRASARPWPVVISSWCWPPAALARWPRAPMFECTIRADGEEIRLTAMVVLVVNAGMLGAAPFRFGPNIAIDDGWLDVCVYRPRTALERAGVLWRILRQRTDGHSMLQRKARSVEIKAPDVQWHEVDGDVHRGNVLRAEIVPGGVRVVA